MKFHPANYAAVWPSSQMPLAMWGVNTDHAILPTAIRQIPVTDFLRLPWSSFVHAEGRRPLYIGIIPYEMFVAGSDSKPDTMPIIFEIFQHLEWSSFEIEPSLITHSKFDDCSLKLSLDAVKSIHKDAALVAELPPKGAKLFPEMSDESYLAQVEQILEDIKGGHYYQLNLLRRFKFAKNWTWPEMCLRIKDHGGPFSSLTRFGNNAVASFSPERFVSIDRQNDSNLWVNAWPIKGTQPSSQPSADLASSKKDIAELNMITDLMRNDLTSVCEPKSVHVVDKGSVKVFKHVHHLQSHITGMLDLNQSVNEIFSRLCPAGSITGAPKPEVIRQIRKIEGQSRGFLMGNAFIIYSDGTFDSNVLIRTAQSKDNARTWSYAAGSGIVIKSEPKAELKEIQTKCKAITE